MKRITRMNQSLWRALILVLIVSLIMVGAAVASNDTHTVDGVTGKTFDAGDEYKASTSTSSARYFLKAHIRAWGQPPNALKAEDEDHIYQNATYIETSDGVWDGYNGVYPSRHSWQNYDGAPVNSLYTSPIGCNCSYCWFVNGTQGSCPSTC